VTSGLRKFLEELKARKVRRTLAIYVSSALTAIAVLRLFSEAYNIPTSIFPIVVTLLTFGVPSAFVFAWHHGKAGTHRFQKKEAIIHGIILLLAISASSRFIGKPRVSLLHENAKSIAVLPFKNMSASKEDEFFSDGITEDILTQLSKISDLRVISRTSVMKYKDTQKTAREIAEELNVGTLLEGSVRRSGDRVRIVGQLINARADEHLWAETYDREIKDIFAIQSEVAQKIASSLKAKLSPEEKERIERKATQNTEAYALYLKGRSYYNRYTKEDNEQSIVFFKKALQLDSAYALAYAGLGDAYSQRVQRYGFVMSWLDSAVGAAKVAISLDPEVAEGYKALGLAYDNQGMRKLALEQYYEAVRLNPNYVSAIRNIGLISYRAGKYDEALQWAQKSVALAPDDMYGYLQSGMALQALGFDSAAIHWYERALQLEPKNPFPRIGLGRLQLTLGNIAEARTQVDSVLTAAPDWYIGLDLATSVEILAGNFAEARTYFEKTGRPADYTLAFLLMKLGNSSGARQILSESITQNTEQLQEGAEGPDCALELAYAHSLLGKRTEALRWLRQAIDAGWRDYRWAIRDPALENLHNAEQFKTMMEQVKAEVNQMRERAKEFITVKETIGAL
jgi:TolB-like protein/Tfp pilus assembly protein PilF